MLYGIQSHFGSTIGPDTCNALQERNYGLCRIDAQGVSIDTMLQMVFEVRDAGMVPYVTVAQVGHIEALPGYCKVEWRNEPDISFITALNYAAELKIAASVARRSDVGTLGGPVTSNLNKRGTDYIQAVINYCGGTLPDNVFGVTHRYGHNNFDTSHRLTKWWPFGPFSTRMHEYAWFARTIGVGRPWGISETGWSTTDLTEQEQADYLRREMHLAFVAGADFCVWYQLNDGAGDRRIDHYGIRRVDGSWKPAADVFVRSS